jgi:hypothetical protein
LRDANFGVGPCTRAYRIRTSLLASTVHRPTPKISSLRFEIFDPPARGGWRIVSSLRETAWSRLFATTLQVLDKMARHLPPILIAWERSPIAVPGIARRTNSRRRETCDTFRPMRNASYGICFAHGGSETCGFVVSSRSVRSSPTSIARPRSSSSSWTAANTLKRRTSNMMSAELAGSKRPDLRSCESGTSKSSRTAIESRN